MVDDAIFRWAGLLVGQGVILVGLVLSHLSSRKANRETNEAIGPVANGFAGHTTESLAEITTSVGELRDLLVGHIADHASADLRRPANRR